MTSMVTIFGYGSLMSYSSVLSTMPSALNFRPASLADYSRSFNLVSISGIKSGTADTSTSEMAALSIRKVEASSGHKSLIRGCIFDIPSIELEPYLEREHRYIPFQTEVIDHQANCAVLSWTVLENTDLDYRASMSEDEWTSRIGQYYSGRLWDRKDILPMRAYLTKCISSAYLLGGDIWLQSMMDSSLADGRSVAEYVKTHPERFPEITEILSTFKNNFL